MPKKPKNKRPDWLRPPALFLALIPMFSVLAQETATVLLPDVLLSLGAAAGILGLVEATGAALGSLARRRGQKLASAPGVRAGTAFASAQGALAVATLILGTACNWPLAALGRVLGFAAHDLGEPLQEALTDRAGSPVQRDRRRALAWTLGTAASVAVPSLLCGLLALGGAPRSLLLLSLFPVLFTVHAALSLGKTGTASVSAPAKAPEPPPAEGGGWDWNTPAPDTRRLLGALACFRLGDFSPSFFILYAVMVLAPFHGAGPAAAWAAGLYALRNASQVAGLSASVRLDARVPARVLLFAGWSFAALAVAALLRGAYSPAGLGLAFAFNGFGSGLSESVDDDLALQTLPGADHAAWGRARALLSETGACLASLGCGCLWFRFGRAAALEAALGLMLLGAALLLAAARPVRELLKDL